MRIAPLIAILIVVVMIGSVVGTTALWIVSALAIAGLGVIIYLSVRQDKFVGPRVLVDDARERLNRMGRDTETNETFTVEVKNKDSSND